uniref:Peptidase M14 domain-containing protein n=3 Tax=Anopheles stephensi TaxID=30069 RepID=A0A182YKX0_ANOST
MVIVWLSTLLTLVVLLFSASIVCRAEQQKFDNYKLYTLYVEDDEQAEELHNWYVNGNLDFWSYGTLNDSVTVMVNPELQEYFEAMLDDVQLESELVEENVQSLLEHEQEQRGIHTLSKRRRPQKLPQKPTSIDGVDEDAVDFDHFWTLDEIYHYMNRLEKTYPNLVRVMTIGKTFENRSILAITVSKDGRINQTRPVVLVDAGVHAREWASHMSALYLIHQLVEFADKNEDLLYNTDWIIIPVANPDGYVYSYETNRLWRKNRNADNVLCTGTDLNRNFPYRWSYTSHSCTDGYAGKSPGSEKETQALMLLMAEFANSIKMYLSVHSCGDYILYPYGFAYKPVPNAEDLYALGLQAAEAVQKIGGPEYLVGQASGLLYLATGSDDFMYGAYGVEYAYTLELSCGDRGYGFIIESNQIETIAKETFEMFKVFGMHASIQKMSKLVVTGCMLALAIVQAGSYHEFEVYNVRPETREQLTVLLKWRNTEVDTDFWDTPKLGRNARLMVTREDHKRVEEFLEKHDIEYDLVAEDVQELLNREQRRNVEHGRRVKRDSNSRATVNFEHFWTLAEIYDYLDELAAAYNGLVRVSEIGRTHEDRPIKAITISTRGTIDQTRPIVFMDGGIHAREWAGVMSVMYMIHEYVEHSEDYAEQLSNTDYVIVPVANPDGYVYTHEQNRLWRKNRSPGNVLCYGVDLNRNFPFMWDRTTTECTNNFAGHAASSENETKALIAAMDQYKAAIRMYLAVHTYGEMILWPWGYDFLHAPNAEDLQRLGEQARDALVAAGGPEYEVGNSADVLYTATGATDDYAYSLGVPYSYTIELTGGGSQGFDLPASDLPRVTSQTFELLKVFGRHAGTLSLTP